jgi:transcriptional regulator with XRE-family HTH domain
MKKTILAKNIKKLRLFKALNQTEFAELFNITRSAVGSYEEGRAEPRLDTLLKIADSFKLSVDEIIRKELTVNQIARFEYPKVKNVEMDQLHEKMADLSKKMSSIEATLNVVLANRKK